jgi:hypothetical protein
MTFWYILFSSWYIFSGFGIVYQVKSGNPAVEAQFLIHDAQLPVHDAMPFPGLCKLPIKKFA